MSSSIWTRCAGDSRVRPLTESPWRVVEAQHQFSTRKLVESDEEQIALEEMIERVKPPSMYSGRLHYLLFTPFRYPPLPHGSRFGTRNERGIWYGSLDQRTAFAEVAYYRLLFLEGTAAELSSVTTALTSFVARVKTRRGVDLTTAPFDQHRRAIASPSSYSSSQALGTAMRASGVEAIRYPSARDADDGINMAVFVPTLFGSANPKSLETWHCTASRPRVEVRQAGYFKRDSFVFQRAQFLVKGVLPAPAL